MRGFKDHLPPISYSIDYIRQKFENLSRQYGCDFIDLPLLENADLYFRTTGVESDICNKELFEVRKYKGDFENWVLRPEGTASCIRAIKESNFMQQQKFARFAYFGPMFRYNRPQKGRYRQFLHAGWEFIGQQGSISDMEVIVAAMELLKSLDLEFILEINSIGNAQDRAKYRQVLAEYYKDILPNTQTDPLKILDKSENINSDIPKIILNDSDMRSFDELCNMLTNHNIKFVHNPFLVRGLDYYNSVVFEFKVQNQTVLAGGRYDGLMEQLGGQYLPAIGFAAGIDRICDYMNYKHINKNIAIIPIDSNEYGLEVANKLRLGAFIQNSQNKERINIAYRGCVMFWNMNLKKALQEADKQGYGYAIICAQQELKNKNFILKDLKMKTETICVFE